MTPLVVDLDGTLLRSDLLVETGFATLGRRPRSIFSVFRALLKGKAALKHCLAGMTSVNVSTLPYDLSVLELIKAAKAEGRTVYLASASAESLVKAVASHLSVFDGWFGSTLTKNLSGNAKAQCLVTAFGERGFDYVGNDKADLRVWSHARRALSVRSGSAVEKQLAKSHGDVQILKSESAGVRTWLRLLRVHQYAKNLLVFVPLAVSHSYGLASITAAVVAFIAFSLTASGVYVLNDLVDLEADRAHRTKRNRPLANGSIPVLSAVLALPFLLGGGLMLAATLGFEFLEVMFVYLALTTAYSFLLKRKLMLDVVVLASLYTWRVIGGAVVIQVLPSQWLLAFSMFIFTSLALMKRYIELAPPGGAVVEQPANRGYQAGDAAVVMMLAAASGFNAVTVLALYINSEAVERLYRAPQLLWLLCPLLMYWLARALALARRGAIDDDPIVFALRDTISRCIGICMIVIAVAAS
jgi:4-hydroxybenzoate polyprenyltransferase/phosphoserine phosphatase